MCGFRSLLIAAIWMTCRGQFWKAGAGSDVFLDDMAAGAEVEVTTESRVRQLPQGPLLIGYATRCHNKVIEEAESGVNVIIWFAANLARDKENGTAVIEFGLDFRCIAQVARSLADKGLETAHLVSVGGWDAPHPDTSFSGAQWWEAWHNWNEDEVAQPDLGFAGFDGIDWDLEGNDDPSSRWNHFTPACMELVGTMSQAAKSAGFVVTLVPPQSYLDVETSGFDLSLRHAYENYHPEFFYRGRNCYALLLAEYDSAPGLDTGAHTFDLVSIQLYESWSRTGYALQSGVSPEDYLVDWIKELEEGWVVNFTEVPLLGLPPARVAVEPRRLVVGLSFGSSGGKSPYIAPEAVGRAFARLPVASRPRGAMFWNLDIDGGPANGTSVNISMAVGLSSFLATRQHHPTGTPASGQMPETNKAPGTVGCCTSICSGIALAGLFACM